MSRIFLAIRARTMPKPSHCATGLAAKAGKMRSFLTSTRPAGLRRANDWEKKLNEAANRCEAVLFLCPRRGLRQDWCGKELNLAHRLNKRLFGILIEELPVVDMPSDLTDEWQIISLASGTDG